MTILLQQEKLAHINTIAHEGKVVVVGTDTNGKIFYTVKQDGFKDSYLNTPEDQRTGWEDWQELELPNEEKDDQSVIDKEKEELTHQDDTSKFILRSRYRTQDESAAAPVQLVSGMGHIYIFRQSKATADTTKATPNTLLVDRFVLDGMTNKLVPKLEVRFKRSRKKYEPIESMKKKADGGLANIDSLDFRDANGNEFYEPTTELTLITASYVDSDIGSWEKVEEKETGLIFDGSITGFEWSGQNKLKVTAFNHGLEHGDEVQIVETRDYNDKFGIQKIDDNNFVVNGLPWQLGEAVNLRLKSRKRRGVMFNGTDEYIDIPDILELTPPSTEFAFGYTVSAWVYVSATGSGEQIIVGEKNNVFQLLINNGTVTVKVRIANSHKQVNDTANISRVKWVHYAGIIASDGTSNKTTLTLCKDGQEVGTPRDFTALPNTPEKWQPKLEIGKSFAGKIADVQIWDKARTAQEIKDSMYLQLSGREADLEGYWRLGAISKEKVRKVVDFSAHGNDGIVHGDAFVSAITLSRKLRDNTTEATKYSNDDLVAVSARAT